MDIKNEQIKVKLSKTDSVKENTVEDTVLNSTKTDNSLNNENNDKELSEQLNEQLDEQLNEKLNEKLKDNLNETFSPDIQYNSLKDSIKKNTPFYLILFACMYYFTINTNESKKFNKSIFFKLLINIIIMSFYGVIVHYDSHHTTITKLYEHFKEEKGNMLTRNKTIDKLLKAGCRIIDFHSITHHDSDINKKPISIFCEFINNVCTQGLLLLLTKKFLNFLDSRIIVLWAFLYATIHNINYLYIKPITHAQHHIKDITNYGIDIWDIVLNTKYNLRDIESHNHYSINILILTYLIVKYLNTV